MSKCFEFDQKGKGMRLNAISLASTAILLLASTAASAQVVVRINDVPNAAPVVTVIGAPNGYDVYTGPEIATPGIEDGAYITLFGVDSEGEVPELGWRFKDSRDPDTLPPFTPLAPDDLTNYRYLRVAVDIVWIEHDADGNLAIGFNSALQGTWYSNGGVFNSDMDASYVTNRYVTLYESDILVVQYKPHTYISKGK